MNSFAFSKLCTRISLSALSLIGDSSGVCNGCVKLSVIVSEFFVCCLLYTSF